MISILLALVLILGLASGAAADETDVLRTGRISVMMPQILVELKGTEHDLDDLSATLDSCPLTVEQTAPYDPSIHTTRAYVLVDLSTSMRGTFDMAKKNIKSFIEMLGDRDELVLITFGRNEVTTVLTGGEDRDTRIAAVEELKCDETGTLFFEALSRAYQLSNTSVDHVDREYAVVFSDGIDYQTGNTTFEEVEKMYAGRNFPLYAACTSKTSKEASNQVGQIARSSGGDLQIIRSEENFADLVERINDVTLITLKANTNHADGREQLLAIQLGNFRLENTVPVIRSIPDTQAPEVEHVAYDSRQNVIVVRFSEPVLGADVVSAYKVTDIQGNVLPLIGVYYEEAEGQYELKLSQDVYNGTYAVGFSRITDNSQEANSVTGNVQFVVADGLDVVLDDEPEKEPVSVWLIVGLISLAVLILSLIVVLVVRSSKKKAREAEKQTAEDVDAADLRVQRELYEYSSVGQNQVKHHIIAETPMRVRINIRTGRISEQQVEMDMVNSLIIGRSQICDIYIDDTKLSRQHCVVERDGEELFIMDLQSRNGTLLNGVRLSGRQNLHSGDKILVGLTEIVVSIIRS